MNYIIGILFPTFFFPMNKSSSKLSKTSIVYQKRICLYSFVFVSHATCSIARTQYETKSPTFYISSSIEGVSIATITFLEFMTMKSSLFLSRQTYHWRCNPKLYPSYPHHHYFYHKTIYIHITWAHNLLKYCLPSVSEEEGDGLSYPSSSSPSTHSYSPDLPSYSFAATLFILYPDAYSPAGFLHHFHCNISGTSCP